MRKRLHTLRVEYTDATFYFDRQFPVFARCCPCRMRHIFFLFSPISLGHSVCVRVCVCISLALLRQQFCDFLGFFSTHVCQRSIISQTVGARNEFHIWNCQRHTFYPLSRIDRKRTSRSGIVDSINNRCNKCCIKKDISA